MSKTITRSTVNEQQYSAQPFPKSGFNLSHRRYSSYILGRIHCSGYQDVMPGDKIAGKNDGTFTFNNIVTPMIPKVDVQQYNFLMPWRSIDRSFERAFAPNKNNNFSQSWSVPTISTRQIVNGLISTLVNDIYVNPQENSFLRVLLNYLNPQGVAFDYPLSYVVSHVEQDEEYGFSLSQYLYGDSRTPDSVGVVGGLFKLFSDSAVSTMFDNLYLSDVLKDIISNIEFKLGSSNNPLPDTFSLRDFFYLYLDTLLTPFVGRYSYFYDYKYNYVRPKDLYRLAHNGFNVNSFANLATLFDDTPLSEYPLRVNYAIWYEYFRNVDLEPVSQSLPYWRDFGSQPVVPLNLALLVYRPRPWYEDMFISAQIDDLSRHVWAPIFQDSSSAVSYNTQSINNEDANNTTDDYLNGSSKPTSYQITWRDQISNISRSLNVPVPANINDILSATDKSFADVYGLDLNSLRQAQQLERYLKRNYLFGDEYNDRMLAHYNSRVSDLRINRPELISQSFNSSDNKQEIANQDNGVANAGDRTATATISSSGDNYSSFCEEFGILVHIITFMPTSCYDGVHPQLFLNKVEHFPLPEFAVNNEEFGRKIEIASSGLVLPEDAKNMFGRYPAYHAWRSRVDEVGGMFLDELQDCTFRRFWGFGDDSIPKLNYEFIHCRPSLQMFRNTNVYDSQIYGDIVHECFVERVLPTPVEQI